MAATNINQNPFPLGQIKPGATFASASKAITANYTDLVTAFADSVVIQAHPSNAGNIYVCTTAATPDLTTFVNVLFVLPPGAFWTDASAAMNTIALGNYYIGGANTTDFALVQARLR